jgi:hypothetical protein
MPVCNTAAMNHFLREISVQLAADAHAVLITDGAACHHSGRHAHPAARAGGFAEPSPHSSNCCRFRSVS